MDYSFVFVAANLSPQCAEWVTSYLDAFYYMYACKFTEAIEAFQTIEAKPGIGDTEMIRILIGQCYHYIGNYDSALYYLKRAHNANMNMGEGLMNLAALYGIKNRLDELERLTMPAEMFPDEYTAEYWFVLAQHMYAQGKHDKAAYFAQKSCFMKPRNVEAALLKSRIFLHLKKYKEAIMQLRHVQQYAAYRLEVFEGLVDAYIATDRVREAQEVSKQGVRRLGPEISARSFVVSLFY